MSGAGFDGVGIQGDGHEQGVDVADAAAGELAEPFDALGAQPLSLMLRSSTTRTVRVVCIVVGRDRNRIESQRPLGGRSRGELERLRRRKGQIEVEGAVGPSGAEQKMRKVGQGAPSRRFGRRVSWRRAPPLLMKNKKSPPKPTAPGNKMPMAESAQTIAHTVAEHQSDPGHHFHARGQPLDSRTAVAAGERLQRVRGRAQAN